MKNNDTQIRSREELRAAMQQAIKEDNAEAFASVWDEMQQRINADMEAAIEQRVTEATQAADTQVLATRGIRQLTSKERTYFQSLRDAMLAKDPKQALTNLDQVMPETVIEAVFEDLRTEHRLLRRINFISSGAAIRMIYNANGYQTAAWGELCDEIVRELTSGFTVVNTNLLKLSAFLPICKEALELGPEWLDRYVREVLYEAFANGLEVGIVTGDGNGMPIGMDRQVGPDVTVTGGVYPKKAAISVNSFDIQTVGNLLSLLAIDPNGKTRNIRDVILVVNPVDYYKKVMPATRVLGADGIYRDILPYPIEIIESPAVNPGTAKFGLAYRYFAAIGASMDGVIDYSDHYQFLQDKRVYLIKGFANGFPMDNNAFLELDISGLKAPVPKVAVVEDRTLGTDAALLSLSLGSAALSPAFAAGTTEYTATTTNATNTINAVPADAGADIGVTMNGTEVPNGSALTWASGENTVVVTVTAEDGTTTKTYTVTVTKS